MQFSPIENLLNRCRSQEIKTIKNLQTSAQLPINYCTTHFKHQLQIKQLQRKQLEKKTRANRGKSLIAISSNNSPHPGGQNLGHRTVMRRGTSFRFTKIRA